ncbi:MAG: hypothetical protein ABIJ65_09015 [Chloroflexota bacterium]
MNTKRPAILTIATICLVLLVLLSSGLALARNFGLLGTSLGAAGFPFGSMMRGQGNFPQGGSQQPGNLPGDGTFQRPGNFDPNDPDTQVNPTTRTFQGGTGTTSGLIRILGFATTGLNIVALVLGLLAAFGLWKQKKWGAVLAIIVAVLILLTSFSGLLSFFSLLIFGEALLKVLLALAVIILLLLPASRKAYAPPADLDLDLDL